MRPSYMAKEACHTGKETYTLPYLRHARGALRDDTSKETSLHGKRGLSYGKRDLRTAIPERLRRPSGRIREDSLGHDASIRRELAQALPSPVPKANTGLRL